MAKLKIIMILWACLIMVSMKPKMMFTVPEKTDGIKESFSKVSRPLVGAIRWDAWHGELSDVGRAVERTLTPTKYHFRLPWFARIHPDGTVTIRGDAPSVLEQEVIYARQAGLDFWSFVTYPEEHPLSLPLLWFLECPSTHGLKFCNIIEWERFEGQAKFRKVVARLVRYFRHPAYLQVMKGRPLLFLLAHEEKPILLQWGSVAAFRQVVETLRQEAEIAQVGNPYIVVMNFNPKQGAEICSQIGADAISAYAIIGGSENGAPFFKALARMQQIWREMVKWAPTVPIVSFGWDPRPRIDTPVPWHRYASLYFETFSPEQCAQALKEAMEFVRAHRKECPSNTIIIYAWNEFDEGGWLCPTLGPDGKPDTRRIEAIGRLLHSYESR